MTGEDVCLAIAADFKKNRISYEEAAKKLGQSVQTVYNRISSKRYFSPAIAERWANAFGFDKLFLMTGDGRLYRTSEKTIDDFFDNIEVMVMAVDYLLSKTNDADVEIMWHDMLSGNYKEFRETESKVNKERNLISRLPIQLQQRLDFLKDYEVYS